MEGEVYPDVRTVALAKEDRLLLCSDGLTGMVADVAIANLLREHANPRRACQNLVDAADVADGRDNITVVVVEWEGPSS